MAAPGRLCFRTHRRGYKLKPQETTTNHRCIHWLGHRMQTSNRDESSMDIINSNNMTMDDDSPPPTTAAAAPSPSTCASPPSSIAAVFLSQLDWMDITNPGPMVPMEWLNSPIAIHDGQLSPQHHVKAFINAVSTAHADYPRCSVTLACLEEMVITNVLS